MLDVMYTIEAISQLGTIQTKEIKTLSGKLLNDPYYQPARDELIVLAHLHKTPIKDIAKFLGSSERIVRHTLQTKLDIYSPTPKLTLNEDKILKEFVELMDVIQKAGI